MKGLPKHKKAHELDPVSLIILADYVGYYYLTRQFDKAIEQSHKINEMDDNFIYGHVYLWISYEQKGMIEEASKNFSKLIRLSFRLPSYSKIKPHTKTAAGKGLWILKYQQTTQPPLNQYVSDYHRALAALRTDDIETVFYWLQKSYEARNRWFVNLKYDPEWDKIRDDPRFAELIRKANLEP